MKLMHATVTQLNLSQGTASFPNNNNNDDNDNDNKKQTNKQWE